MTGQPKTSFTRKKEDFTCEHCGTEVKGNGYTNHCTQCLWSKHVDVGPGDRAALAVCGGMMKPVSIEAGKGGGFVVVHVCEKCGHTRRNKMWPEDNFDEAVRIQKAIGDKLQGKK